MKTSFLEYYKTILQKVCFDDWLYAKEFDKAKRNLSPSEFQKLLNWQKAAELPAPLTEEQLLISRSSRSQHA